MNRILIVITLLMALKLVSHSQEPIKEPTNLHLIYNPSALLNPFPRNKLGLELNNDLHSFGFEIGYGLSKFHRCGACGKNEKYSIFDLRLEYRLLRQHREESSTYYAFEIFHIKRNKQFFNSNNPMSRSGFHIKTGVIVAPKKPLSLNLYLGGGFAYRYEEYTPPLTGNNNIENFEGIIPHITLGVKLRLRIVKDMKLNKS